jgi:uncharacterized protein YndB with AHSA1/START domain
MKSEVEITGNRLRITRIFDAPRDVVFQYWKSVDKLQQWWGCKETTKVESTVDFRSGGTFTHRMQITGAGECLITGEYVEIVEPERISYRGNFGGNIASVTVEFIAQGDRTKVILTQEGLPNQTIVQIVAQGTTESLDKIDRMLSGQAALAR